MPQRACRTSRRKMSSFPYFSPEYLNIERSGSRLTAEGHLSAAFALVLLYRGFLLGEIFTNCNTILALADITPFFIDTL